MHMYIFTDICVCVCVCVYVYIIIDKRLVKIYKNTENGL